MNRLTLVASTLLLCNVQHLTGAENVPAPTDVHAGGAVLMRSTMSYDLSQKIVDACLAHARAKGWAMTVAVVDDAGTLKSYGRMDGTIAISVGLSQAKAKTSSMLPVSTRQFRDIAKNHVGGLELTPGTSTVAGGLPIITASGAHIGGVGVSGGSEDEDELCAQAGLKAVAAVLK